MIRSISQTANPSADAAAILRRLGFAILFFAVPLAALFTRRALVAMAPLAVILLVLASVLDGSARNAREKLTALMVSPGRRRRHGPAALGRPVAGLDAVPAPGFGEASEHHRHGPHGARRLSRGARADALGQSLSPAHRRRLGGPDRDRPVDHRRQRARPGGPEPRARHADARRAALAGAGLAPFPRTQSGGHRPRPGRGRLLSSHP